MIWFASGADGVTYWLTTACTCGSSFDVSGCRTVVASARGLSAFSTIEFVGARRHELAGLVVDRERDVAEDPPERRSARDQAGDAVRS